MVRIIVKTTINEQGAVASHFTSYDIESPELEAHLKSGGIDRGMGHCRLSEVIGAEIVLTESK